jgi:hypothetical protein
MAYPQVSEQNVYLCTGNVSPAHASHLLDILLNSTFEESIQGVSDMITNHGFALTDILEEIHGIVLHLIDLPDQVFRFILEKLALLQHDLSKETNAQIQMSCLVSIFQLARNRAFELVDSA